jgi:hypothetical protein
MHLYSALLDRRHRLPVQSVLVLLRPEADARSLNGVFERRLPEDETYLTFRYRVVRVWQQPLETLLVGPLTTLPLATLAGLSAADMSAVLRRIEARVRDEATPATAEQVRAGTYLLLGLRFPEDVIDDLLRGVGIMAGALKESSTYQKIMREGQAEGLAEGLAQGLARARAEELTRSRELLMRMGSKRFGPPSNEDLAAIGRLNDPEKLAQLAEQVLDVTSWEDLGIDNPAQ